jgi:membrane protease subunit HflK
MGWNEPGKGKDPWSGKNQPPDLEEALKRLQTKLKNFFMAGRRPTLPNDEPPSGTPTEGGGGILAIIIAAIAFILWGLSGIFIVDPAEQAAILRFGKYMETVGPGPHWIPRLICSKIVLNVDRVSDYSYSAQMLTKDENLVSVAIAVQYRIGDLEDYLFNVSDPQESLQQATSSALRQVVGTTTLDQLITEGREAWGSSVQDSLVKILEIYKAGIVIVNVSPQPARAPENVQDAFDDAIKAQEDEKRFKEQAQAYEARVVPIAEGNTKRILSEANAYAEQVVLRAVGDAAEFLALLPEYTRAPFVTGERMYLDAMQQVLNNSSKIVVDGKAGNVLYLPLDKLSANTATSDLLRDKANTNHQLDKQDPSGNNLFDGRGTVRPTERSGRND